MSARDNNANNHSMSKRVQFGGGQAQYSSGQPQSSLTDMAIQLLMNKNKIEFENKPKDKEKQKKEIEKSLESIRRFNQISEEIKKSYDEYVAKTKQREKEMRESLLKAEANYFKVEVRESSRDGESSRDRESSRDQDKNSDSDLDSSKDSDSSDEDVYSKKPKTNSSKIGCEEGSEVLTQKNYGGHIQSLKHKKNEQVYKRNKIFERANESGKKINNKDCRTKDR